MRHLGTAVEIAAPAERAWSVISDFDRWPDWGISVRRVESEADRVATGVTGRIETIAGVWLPFRITDVTPGRSWAWEVARIGATGHRVEPLTDTTCRVEFTAPWIAAPYLAVLRTALGRVKAVAEAP